MYIEYQIELTDVFKESIEDLDKELNGFERAELAGLDGETCQ